jgi:hypothetical protein
VTLVHLRPAGPTLVVGNPHHLLFGDELLDERKLLFARALGGEAVVVEDLGGDGGALGLLGDDGLAGLGVRFQPHVVGGHARGVEDE